MTHLCLAEAQDLAGGTGGADDAKHPLVPAQFSRYDLVGETAKNFIRQDNSRDDRTAITPERVCQGQGRGNHVARMPTTWREVGVVTIEIAHHHPISKTC